MEEIGSTRAIEVAKLAMDGLLMRQNAIAANTANVMTPGYHRKEVVFEDQLRDIISKDNYKQEIKQANSKALSYNASSLDQVQKPTKEQLSVLNKNSYSVYKPEIVADYSYNGSNDGNNVEVEKEMMDMAQTGMQYNILSNLESKMLSGLSDVIKGVGGSN
jgi:flagellar basal-body rod protein FlgB